MDESIKDYDPLNLHEQEVRREKLIEAAKKRQEQDIADFRWLMSFREGRRIVWNMLSDAHVFQGNFNESHAVMSFLEGERSSGLRLLKKVTDHTPELYLVMHRENTDVREVGQRSEG